MRNEQGRQRLREARHVLGDVDQGHGEIARGVQNRKAQGADQNDIAGRCRSALPQ